jgi:hypothetical protein
MSGALTAEDTANPEENLADNPNPENTYADQDPTADTPHNQLLSEQEQAHNISTAQPESPSNETWEDARENPEEWYGFSD